MTLKEYAEKYYLPEQPAQPQPQEGKKIAACDIETSGKTDSLIAGLDAKNYSTLPAITLSYAEGITQQKNNRYYRKNAKIHNLTELLAVARYDHVAGIFRNNHRTNKNFLNADCIIMDVDNTHSDNQADWLTPEKLAAQLPGVAFYFVYSKSHNKDKIDDNGNITSSPRPRFHVYFFLSKTYDNADNIADIKAALLRLVPEFDSGAKDAARFIYGVDNPDGKYNEGTLYIDLYLAEHSTDMFTATAPHKGKGKTDSTGLIAQHIARQTDMKGYFDFIGNPSMIIPEGNRHAMLLQIAVGAISNEQPLDCARQTYEKACRQCRPPHDKQDIARIWNDAKEYVKGKQEEQASASTSTGKKKSRPLFLCDIERALQHFNITMKFDVITKRFEVSDLPVNGTGLHEGYKNTTPEQRRNLNIEALPLFLSPIFKTNHYTFDRGFLYDSLNAIAKSSAHNPVLDMLNATTWDKQDRIDKLCKVLGICRDDDDNDTFSTEEIFYCHAVEKWLHQAIALALNDKGTRKQEFLLVLQGAQGLGKTNLFRALAVYPEWFRGGTVIDMRVKDTVIQATKTWICELGELDSTLKKEQSSLKGHITEPLDDIRMPYGRTWDTTPRRTCYCATVNPEQVHNDDTGSRRFVYIHIEHIDKDYLYSTMFQPEWARQLWRQVYEQLYLPNPEGYYLTDEEQAYNEKNTQQFRKPLKAQTELEDLIDFEECYKPEPAGFGWYSASQIKERLNLRMYSANQIGQALKYLCTLHPHCESRILHGKKQYYLPPAQGLTID